MYGVSGNRQNNGMWILISFETDRSETISKEAPDRSDRHSLCMNAFRVHFILQDLSTIRCGGGRLTWITEVAVGPSAGQAESPKWEETRANPLLSVLSLSPLWTPPFCPPNRMLGTHLVHVLVINTQRDKESCTLYAEM